MPCTEQVEEGADDEDGCLRPPLLAFAGGGGLQTPLRPGSSWVQVWSIDEDTQGAAGFLCVHDMARNVFYAKLQRAEGTEDEKDGEATKGAITTLLDIAEALDSRKISLGLGAAQAADAELICSLLYLGFQVAPSRKFPLAGTVLLLDFDMGWAGGAPYGPDHTCTGTSECSTSAEDELLGEDGALGSLDSD